MASSLDQISPPLADADALARRGPIRFPGEGPEYRAARTALLGREIALRREIEAVAALRRRLPPGGIVADGYRFRDERGEHDIASLFGAHDTLMLYSFMFGPERERPCPMCTNLLGPVDAVGADLAQRLAFVVVVRSPVERARAFARTRGWRHLRFVQDVDDSYSRAYFGLLADGSEVPALNVFSRRDGIIRHFWSGEMTGDSADPGQDPRGAPDLSPLWTLLDLTPEGRGRDWYPALDY